MEDNVLMTYALLSHLKETHNAEKGSLIKIFEPIVKKALVEYSIEKGNSTIMGKNISEIQSKINSFFGIEIPNGVLSIILRQISDEVKDEKYFVFHTHGSFIINSFIFNDIDKNIAAEQRNIQELQKDYRLYCEINRCKYNFEELLNFIFSLNIDLFTNEKSNVTNIDYTIPKYIKLKLSDKKIFGTISDIYLGNILSSYLSLKINSPVTNTELLLDTNFFISLIDLNTEEAYLTCKQLYDLGKAMGFKFSMLYSTVEQIKVLLNSRIQDFANKELGFIREADIFGACIRKNLDKTQLERIKDKVDTYIREFNIEVIAEARIQKIVDESKKSQKYKDLIERRHGYTYSALNDTIAYYYVKSKRGNNINEFADVKCWFLHNSYKKDYESTLGYKIHERNAINANELLTLLWLTNPNQANINTETISKGGLASYVAKYRYAKLPSTEIIKQINEKAKNALKFGKVEEKDIYSISIRMSEGHLANDEAEKLVELPDEQFIDVVKSFSLQDDNIRMQLNSQNEELESIKAQVSRIEEDNKKLKSHNLQILFESALNEYENRKELYVNTQFLKKDLQYRKYTWFYIIFTLFISTIWMIDKAYSNLLSPVLGIAISFVLMVVALFLIKFVDHKTILQCMSYTFSKKLRLKITTALRKKLGDEFELMNKKPQVLDFTKE